MNTKNIVTSLVITVLSLDVVTRIIVIVFCMWLVFSVPDVSYTWLQSVGYVLLCLVTVGVLGAIPFIGPLILLPLIPVGWEWWWLDVELLSVSTLAWGLFIGIFVVRSMLAYAALRVVTKV